MLDHKVSPDIIKVVGINWLKHFEPNPSPARYKAIVTDFNYCVDHTVKTLARNKTNKYITRSSKEDLELEKSLIISFTLHKLLNFFHLSNQCSVHTSNLVCVLPMYSLLRGDTSPQEQQPEIELIKQNQKGEEMKQY